MMKTIKIYLMIILLMAFVFASCNQPNVVPDAASTSVDGIVDVTTEDPMAGDEEEDEDGDDDDDN